MTKMPDMLDDFMIFLRLSYSRFDGSSSASSRQKSIAEFNAPDSSTFVFLISTCVGGLGINLPSAETVIMYDLEFNPFVDLQAQSKSSSHWRGQNKFWCINSQYDVQLKRTFCRGLERSWQWTFL